MSHRASEPHTYSRKALYEDPFEALNLYGKSKRAPRTAPRRKPWRARLRLGRGSMSTFFAVEIALLGLAFLVTRDVMTDGPLSRGTRGVLSSLANQNQATEPQVVNEEPRSVASEKVSILSTPPDARAVKVQKIASSGKGGETKVVNRVVKNTTPERQIAVLSGVSSIGQEDAVPIEKPKKARVTAPVANLSSVKDEIGVVPEVSARDVALASQPPPVPVPGPVVTVEPPAVPAKPIAVMSVAQSPVADVADAASFRDCEMCPEMVRIAGTTAQALAISRTEVTFDQWQQCVTEGGCTAVPDDRGWGRGSRPVINVSYNDVTQQYLVWLSRKAGRTYRLPSDAEWSLAAGDAAAPASAQGSSACSSANAFDEVVQGSDGGCQDGFAATAPVGQYEANTHGLFDMHGNVWEWVADCWTPRYSTKASVQSQNCDHHVLRGGSFSSDRATLAAAARGWERSDKARESVGFRVVAVLP